MWVKELKLANFRNYEEVALNFEKGVNVIQGDNGTGKTSLVESIAYLPLCKSIRTNEDKELIKFGCDFSRIDALIEKKRKCHLKIVITPKGKRIEIDDVEVKKISEIAGICKVVSFLPKDVELFKEPPLRRRKFIDSNLSMVDSIYLKLLSEYNHLLNDLRMILKQKEFDKELTKTLIDSLAKRGKILQQKRIKFIEEINEFLQEFAKYLDDKSSKMKLIYQPDMDIYLDESYERKCIQRFEHNLLNANSGRIIIPGIHLDDVKFEYNDKDLSTYGSQGQNRLSVIALKLSLFKWISKRFDEEPIVILDDVLSELDEYHQRKLIRLLNRIEQVFVTGTKIDLEENFNLYSVKGNKIWREN